MKIGDRDVHINIDFSGVLAAFAVMLVIWALVVFTQMGFISRNCVKAGYDGGTILFPYEEVCETTIQVPYEEAIYGKTEK